MDSIIIGWKEFVFQRDSNAEMVLHGRWFSTGGRGLRSIGTLKYEGGIQFRNFYLAKGMPFCNFGLGSDIMLNQTAILSQVAMAIHLKSFQN